MWIQPINSESLGRNKLKTRNHIGIPWVSVNIGIGKLLAPARVYRRHPHSGNRFRGRGIEAGKSAPPGKRRSKLPRMRLERSRQGGGFVQVGCADRVVIQR